MGWFDDNHWAGEAYNFGFGYMCGGSGLESGGGGRDPFTGHYEPGTRKCSMCQKLKTKSDFNKEQAKKPAAKRICNDCGAPLPSDLNNCTAADLKKELTKRNLKATGLKAELVARLSDALAGESPAPASAAAEPALPPTLKSLTVQRLKQELGKRGLPVSGLKAELLERLSTATGIPVESTRKRKADAAPPAEEVPKKMARPSTEAEEESDNLVFNDTLQNLLRRFPELGSDVVEKELTKARGHGGLAARVLRGLASPVLAAAAMPVPLAPPPMAAVPRRAQGSQCGGSPSCRNTPSGACAFGCCRSCCEKFLGAAASRGACPRHPERGLALASRASSSSREAVASPQSAKSSQQPTYRHLTWTRHSQANMSSHGPPYGNMTWTRQ